MSRFLLLFFFTQLGKSVVAKVKTPKGTILTADMLTVKVAEPMGVKAEDIFELVGKTVMEDVEEDESIVPEVVDSYGKKAKCWRWLEGWHWLMTSRGSIAWHKCPKN